VAAAVTSEVDVQDFTGVCTVDTVYLVMIAGVDAGLVHETVARPSPAMATTAVGAAGAVEGATATDAAEADDVPSALVALTVKE
jgi:hypothetical protein